MEGSGREIKQRANKPQGQGPEQEQQKGQQRITGDGDKYNYYNQHSVKPGSGAGKKEDGLKPPTFDSERHSQASSSQAYRQSQQAGRNPSQAPSN